MSKSKFYKEIKDLISPIYTGKITFNTMATEDCLTISDLPTASDNVYFNKYRPCSVLFQVSVKGSNNFELMEVLGEIDEVLDMNDKWSIRQYTPPNFGYVDNNNKSVYVAIYSATIE